MVNGVDYVGFFVTFGGGVIVGVFLGMMIYSAMSEQDKEDMNDE